MPFPGRHASLTPMVANGSTLTPFACQGTHQQMRKIRSPTTPPIAIRTNMADFGTGRRSRSPAGVLVKGLLEEVAAGWAGLRGGFFLLLIFSFVGRCFKL